MRTLTAIVLGLLLLGVSGRAETPLGAPFALPDVAGRQHTLAEYRDRVVVLNFWAFWCDTWKAEMPHLRSLAARQDERGFHLVAISVDGTRLQEFEAHHGAPTPFPVLLDVGSTVSRQYGVAHVPTVVILDRHGRVYYVHSGYPGNDVVLSQVRRALAR